jgi:hypothetical protein
MCYSKIIFLSPTIKGTVWNLNKNRSGRKPSALTGNKLQMMQDLMDGNIMFHIM